MQTKNKVFSKFFRNKISVQIRLGNFIVCFHRFCYMQVELDKFDELWGNLMIQRTFINNDKGYQTDSKA